MYVGEDKVIDFVSKSKRTTLEEITTATGLNIDSVRRIIEVLKEGGYISVEQSETDKLLVTPEMQSYHSSGGLPEFSVYNKAADAKKHGKELEVSKLSAQEKQFGLRWAKIKGLVAIESGKIIPVKDKGFVDALCSKFNDVYSKITSNSPIDAVIIDELFTRKLLVRKPIKSISVVATGKKYEVTGDFDVAVESRDYDVGKNHPVTKMMKRIKSIFAELGFEEMQGDIIESAFWNFDALFQPQDHPARDLADTFYLNGVADLPDKKLVDRVKKAHESGWKYKWDESEAKRKVLRTHTTALSARYVAAIDNNIPKKYFAIGRVFRNEATDYKHLAEFHQVEGIISWKNATFRDLLGVLREFYKKLGFEKIRFRPSFFPYTEPSLEVEIYYEPRKEWMELGGAGMFRPEVSIPLSGAYPVLAWGLSLERPLMLELNLRDIRTIYRNDLEFLKSTRLKD